MMRVVGNWVNHEHVRMQTCTQTGQQMYRNQKHANTPRQRSVRSQRKHKETHTQTDRQTESRVEMERQIQADKRAWRGDKGTDRQKPRRCQVFTWHKREKGFSVFSSTPERER